MPRNTCTKSEGGWYWIPRGSTIFVLQFLEFQIVFVKKNTFLCSFTSRYSNVVIIVYFQGSSSFQVKTLVLLKETSKNPLWDIVSTYIEFSILQVYMRIRIWIGRKTNYPFQIVNNKQYSKDLKKMISGSKVHTHFSSVHLLRGTLLYFEK